MVTVRTEDLSYKKRCYVQALRHAGWTYDQIAKNQGISMSTVWKICHSPATSHRKGQCGREIKINTPTPCRLVFTVTMKTENRHKTFPEIAQIACVETYSVKLSASFAKGEYHPWSAGKKLYFNKKNKFK